MAAPSPVDLELADKLALFYDDPLSFVKMAYPWGEPGMLEDYPGPDTWQAEFLTDLGEQVRERGFDGKNAVMPLRNAVSSGHGIGKSVLVAWLVDWLMSTRPHCQGTITANTMVQLSTKTWAQIQKWTRMCITSHWFTINSEKMYHTNFKESWFCSAQSCREENSESFAGQHAVSSTSFYIFDEASAVPDTIYEVAEGGLTDGEPHIYLFGNPTRNTGKFYRAAFGSETARWSGRCIDSRTSAFANQSQIAEWIEDYGDDSDFVRVRVKGQPPAASELQFIGADLIKAAQKRTPQVLGDDPLVAGFDVSGGGSAWNVIHFRRGNDAVSIPSVRITGQVGKDRSILIAKCSEILKDERPEYKVAAMFVDSAFGSPIVERLHTLGYRNVHEVNFGGESPDIHQENKRSYMWNRMKEWLQNGAVPKSENFAIQLGGPGYHINKRNKLVLESKESMQERGEASPDDADALALTFAQHVAPPKPKSDPIPTYVGSSLSQSWMG